jgi:dihydrofolate reductase
VVSRTIESVGTNATLIRYDLVGAIRRLKAEQDGEIEIAGPTLAADAYRAGLFDRVELYVYPVIVGGGKRALPDGVRLDLRLVDEHRFENGTVYLSYAR